LFRVCPLHSINHFTGGLNSYNDGSGKAYIPLSLTKYLMIVEHQFVSGTGFLIHLHFANQNLISFFFEFGDERVHARFHSNYDPDSIDEKKELQAMINYDGIESQHSYNFNRYYLRSFNRSTVEQYAELILRPHAEARHIKAYLYELISFVDALLDYRFHDVLIVLKKLIHDEDDLNIYYTYLGEREKKSSILA